MKRFFLTLFWLVCIMTVQTASAQVSSVADLITAVQGAGGDAEIQLSPAFPTTLGATIALTIPHGHNIIINGDQGGTPIVLEVSSNFRHFSIGKSVATGSLTFKNIVFKGRRTAAETASNTAVGTEGGGVAINSPNSGPYRFDNVKFDSIGWGGAPALSYVNTPVEIVNSTFEYNAIAYGHGGAISGAGNLTVSHSAFVENRCFGAGGYAGGAIGMINYVSTADISNSVFLNNKSNIRGGAVSFHQSNNATVTISTSHFEGNETLLGTSTSDGGAISVFNPGGSVHFELNNSTFYKNVAADDGGALFLENNGGSASNLVTNCTMVENTARDFHDPTTLGVYASGGGAVQLSLGTTATFKHNTFIGNTSTAKGGALGVHAHATQGTPSYILQNNIILGNTASGNNLDNVAARNWTGSGSRVTDQGGNLGIDNGSAITPAGVTLEKVFGTNTPQLAENQNTRKAGNPNETGDPARYQVLRTLPILLNDGKPGTSGMADGTGVTTAIAADERGYDRIVATPDIGAVEMLWVRFDANGGKISGFGSIIPDETEHFTANLSGDIDTYYRITYSNATVASPPGTPTRAGFAFGGWVLDNGLSTPWNPADPVTDNTKVIAVWAPLVAATLRFDGNGASLGSVANIATATGATEILPTNGFTYPGHIFMEWNTAANGSGTGYQPGDAFTITLTDQTLYARWVPDTAGVIVFNANGGSGTMPSATTAIGSTHNLPANGFTRAGFTFVEWNTAANGLGTGYQPGDPFPVTASYHTLYAHWVANGNAIIRFVANGGTGSMADVVWNIGTPYTLPPNGFTNGVKAFWGWSVTADCSGTLYQPGNNINVTQPLHIFYARWEHTHTVTYVCPFGTPLPATENIVPGVTYNVSGTVPGRASYQFSGWHNSHYSNIHQPNGTFQMPDRDVVMSARWAPLAGGGATPLDIPTTPIEGLAMLIALMSIIAGIMMRREPG